MLQQNYTPARVLIADDEPAVRRVLCELLTENYQCVEVGSAEEALDALRAQRFNLIVSDVNMNGISGLDMLPEVSKIAPDAIVIMISGHQNIENAIRALRAGAFDYITKPFAFDHVEAVVMRALEHQMLRETKKFYEQHLEEQIVQRTQELRQEIIERQRAEETVNRMAYYDLLTNLPNAALFKDRLTHELGRANKKKSTTIFLAVDRFKNICDTLGHHVGDELLCQIAERLTKSVRGIDTTAYFGGGEFALLATDIGGAEECAKIVQTIKDCLHQPFVCHAQELFITASCGISLTPNDGDDCQTLLKNASTALHRARQSGGDSYQFYTADMHARALKSLSLENSLRRALERQEFVVHYQPQICAQTNRLIGAEALVRWQHPELGMISPLEFIPIAEAAGLIVPLGEWVLRTACAQTARWQRGGFPGFRIAVNLSLRQFQQNNVVETVRRALAEARLDAQFLELEITESALMNNAELTCKTLRHLRKDKLKISIDDFGSGYSSLSYLKNLPIDRLKIDRAFVADIAHSASDAAIVKTIITLAQNLNLKTIAEGVETPEQSRILIDFGCDEMQGFLFSKPLAAEALEKFLNDRRTINCGAAHNLETPFELKQNDWAAML